VEKHKFNTAEQPAKIAEMFVTDNIVKSMLSFDLIAIISAGIIIGLFIETPELNGGEGRAGAPKKSFVFIAFMREINKVCFKLIAILVAFTPIGVFSLVAAAVAQSNLGSLMKDIGLFLATVLSGLAFHALIVYPCLFFLFTRSNPFRVMKNVMPAFLTAMSTASSAATFPVTYRNAVDNNKVRPSTAKFVLSLGMTMNMDGTAIGFPCAVIFMANANGMALSFGQIVGMAFTSAMASMGAGPIPSAGLVMLVSILSSVGIDATTNPIFGLIIAVDWVYDRPETALNIFGDSLGAVVVDRYTAKSNEDGLAGTEMTNTA
jgi:Na+/H+-dicarboxylate symporter